MRNVPWISFSFGNNLFYLIRAYLMDVCIEKRNEVQSSHLLCAYMQTRGMCQYEHVVNTMRCKCFLA